MMRDDNSVPRMFYLRLRRSLQSNFNKDNMQYKPIYPIKLTYITYYFSQTITCTSQVRQYLQLYDIMSLHASSIPHGKICKSPCNVRPVGRRHENSCVPHKLYQQLWRAPQDLFKLRDDPLPVV